MSPVVSVAHPMISLLTIGIVLIKVGEAGVSLQLIPFKESSHAVRLVPNTPELDELIDRTLDSIRRLAEVEGNDPFPIGAYKHSYQISNGSVSGVFQTGRGVLWGSADLVRSGSAYIYNNEEDSIQAVTEFVLSPLTIKYPQYNATLGELKETGSVDGIVDKSRVDVRITLRARQNNSRPLIFVCDGKVDELSLTPGDVHFSLSGTQFNRDFHTAVLDGLTDQFNNNVAPQLQKLFTSSLESVVRRDEELCYSLVLCNSCEFYAADS